MTNPLLQTEGLAAYNAIRPEHVVVGIGALLAQAGTALESAHAAPAEFEALSSVLDMATEQLDRAWNDVEHLKSVLNTPELRAAYNETLPAVTAFHTKLGADTGLFAKYKAVAESDTTLTAPRRQVLGNTLRDFKLGGAELTGPARDRFAQIQARKAALSQQFSEHVLDATDGFTLDTDEARLAGLPADALQAARVAAQAAGVPGARLTLHMPSYLPAMRHLQDRALRQTLYTAYITPRQRTG